MLSVYKDVLAKGLFIVCILLAFSVSVAHPKALKNRSVVIYTSLDQIFSEPILNDFEKDTGIKVKAVYDTEASKTTGLVNRLIAEKNNPQADVFWNSEVSRTIILKNKGILARYESPSARDIPSQFKDKDAYWAGFAARARVLIYNTDLVKPEEAPGSIFELTQPKWRGQVALAYPLFGTTSTHIGALYASIGKEKTEDFLKRLKNNDVVIVDGNASSRDRVVEGELKVGFTDTDDANIAIQAGRPIKMIYPDSKGIGTLLIPNTVALIKGGPNPGAGKRLIDYLLSREVESKLSYLKSAQMPLRKGVKTPGHIPSFDEIKAMEVDFEDIAKHLREAMEFCQKLFIR